MKLNPAASWRTNENKRTPSAGTNHSSRRPISQSQTVQIDGVVNPRILFIQGGGSGAHKEDEKLVASLRTVLGCEVDYPRMPNEGDPEYECWKPQIKRVLAAAEKELILVGHSWGASFLLKYLSDESIEAAIIGLFFVATPFWGGNGWQYEGYETAALPEDFASKLLKRAPVFFYHSRDDEIVPFAHLALYAEKVPGATIRVLDGRGHQLSNDLSEVAADIKSLEQFKSMAGLAFGEAGRSTTEENDNGRSSKESRGISS
jgi:uncharacterized protein